MSENLLHTIYLAGAFLVLFASAELLYHKLGVSVEITRKYVHLLTGLLTMLFPPLIGNHWLVLALCGSFLIILVISLILQQLPSINAVERVTRGSILYPIIVYGCYLVFREYDQFMYYYIPILILAICDPIATLIGKKWPKGQYTTFGHTKTLSGSFGFFAIAIAICLVLILGLEEATLKEAIIMAFGVAFLTAIAEALTHKGYDNLTIPTSALLVLILVKELI
jgi:dolichol kinase